MAHIKTISAKDVTPEEITQVQDAISKLPEDSALREFIGELLSGLDLGLNMALIFEDPKRIF